MRLSWYALPKNVRVISILAASFVVWQCVVVAFKIPELLLPSPLQVLKTIVASPQFYLIHTLRTFYETAMGFALAVLIGVVLSVLIISSRFLEETIYVLLIGSNGIPKVAVAPLFVVWLGTGFLPKVAISATIAMFVIVIDLVLGFRSVDRDMLDLARSLKGSRWKTLFLIRFPHALPNLFAGMKAASTLALIGSVVRRVRRLGQGTGLHDYGCARFVRHCPDLCIDCHSRRDGNVAVFPGGVDRAAGSSMARLFETRLSRPLNFRRLGTTTKSARLPSGCKRLLPGEVHARDKIVRQQVCDVGNTMTLLPYKIA